MKLSTLRSLVFLLIVLLSLFLWMIFSPGLMNADSIAQYQQALSGNFDDWHSPIMVIIVHSVLKMEGSMGTVTLIQIFLGFTGVYLLSRIL